MPQHESGSLLKDAQPTNAGSLVPIVAERWYNPVFGIYSVKFLILTIPDGELASGQRQEYLKRVESVLRTISPKNFINPEDQMLHFMGIPFNKTFVVTLDPECPTERYILQTLVNLSGWADWLDLKRLAQ